MLAVGCFSAFALKLLRVSQEEEKRKPFALPDFLFACLCRLKTLAIYEAQPEFVYFFGVDCCDFILASSNSRVAPDFLVSSGAWGIFYPYGSSNGEASP
jgi:hypothetical protein